MIAIPQLSKADEVRLSGVKCTSREENGGEVKMEWMRGEREMFNDSHLFAM